MSENKANSPFELNQTDAYWIWPARVGNEANQYIDFRQDFDLDRIDPSAELLVSADSNYAAWLNGELVDFGQYGDFPDRKTYDRLPIGQYLRAGSNSLRITAYYQGVESFQYVKGPPGVIFALRSGAVVASSSQATQYRRYPGYAAGEIARVTRQLGFSFEFDARIAGKSWEPIQTADLHGGASSRPLDPRPIEKLILRERPATVICAQGVFRRDADAPSADGIGPLMQRDFLSARFPREILSPSEPLTLPSDPGIEIDLGAFREQGAYLVIDLHAQEAGLLDIEVDTDADVRIDIAYGEHLDDLRVRAAVGGRNFANRYTCREGRQTFVHYFSRLAGRYLQLHVSGVKTRFKLHYAGLRPTEYPVQRRGLFNCSDGVIEQFHQVGIRTLHLCMHEHYEDTPWREQALYAFDGRNQALCGYHCFGEYSFPAASFALLGRSLGEDGYQQMCAPADIDHTIPSFSFASVLAVADHWLYSADRSAVQRAWSWVWRMMQVHLSRRMDDLLPCPTGKRYWQFYDWAPGLDGAGRILDPRKPRFDAPLNLLFCLALTAAANLGEAVGDSSAAATLNEAADRLRRRIATAFWDQTEAAYQTYIGADAPRHFSELTQALALLAGVPTHDIASRLRQRLTQPNNGMIATTLSHSLYKFEALLTEPRQHGRWVFDTIARDWGHMLRRGATSFWETIRGGDDFNQAGSLCHGWSAIPVYFNSTCLLGVRPIEPGFRRFTVSPVAGVVNSAQGEVPTPFGPIRIHWTSDGDRFEFHQLSYPEQIEPVNQPDGLLPTPSLP